MTVREFDGIDDEIVFATGGLSGITFGTVAFLVERTAAGTWDGLFYPHNSSGIFLGAIGINTTATWYWQHTSGTQSDFGAVSTGIWYTVMMRKTTGLVAPRFSVYNHTALTWAHGIGSTTRNNWTAPDTTGSIRTSFQSTGDFPSVRLAAMAAWSNTLPWSADTTGDTAIEAAGLHTAASNWLAASPSAFWLFNQASVATPVEDLSTAGTAVQTSIAGTTVITGDDPPGFSFGDEPPPPDLEEGPQRVIQRSNLRLG